MCLRGARGGARTGSTLDRAHTQTTGFGYTFEARQHVACSSHVSGFFLHPNNLARIRMLSDRGGYFSAGHGVKLVQEENSRAGVLAATAFGAQFMAHFATGDQNATGVLHIAVRYQWQEAWLGK